MASLRPVLGRVRCGSRRVLLFKRVLSSFSTKQLLSFLRHKGVKTDYTQGRGDTKGYIVTVVIEAHGNRIHRVPGLVGEISDQT